MKTNILVFSMSLLLSLFSCAQDFQKLSETKIDANEKQIAENFAIHYLSQLRDGEYYTFTDEAIEVFAAQLTEQNQKAGYQQVKDKFGDYESLSFAEAWIQPKQGITIFRFKGKFSNSVKQLEVRVVLDKAGKIAGFWIRPWSDMLN